MIDWARVEELRSEVGEDDFAAVAEIFFEEVEEVIADLKANPDESRYQARLHFLKGSALNLGFATLAELCKTGEHASAEGRSEEVELSRIFDAYDMSKAQFMAQGGFDSAA